MENSETITGTLYQKLPKFMINNEEQWQSIFGDFDRLLNSISKLRQLEIVDFGDCRVASSQAI